MGLPLKKEVPGSSGELWLCLELVSFDVNTLFESGSDEAAVVAPSRLTARV